MPRWIKTMTTTGTTIGTTTRATTGITTRATTGITTGITIGIAIHVSKDAAPDIGKDSAKASKMAEGTTRLVRGGILALASGIRWAATAMNLATGATTYANSGVPTKRVTRKDTEGAANLSRPEIGR